MKKLILIILTVTTPLYLREAYAAKGDKMPTPSIILNACCRPWHLQPDGKICADAVLTALKNGYRLIDTVLNGMKNIIGINNHILSINSL